MDISLRQIGTFMDPVDETIGLRHVLSHHRWVDGIDDATLATMGRRHIDPVNLRLRFLWYNTYLMRVRLALAKGLADASTPSEIMDVLGITPKRLLEELDEYVCDLLPTPARQVCQAAGDAVEFVIDKFGGVNSVVDAIIDMLGVEKVIKEILIIAGVPEEIVFKKKPALKARACEIGDVLRNDGYDLVALCETWNADLRDDLLGHWSLPSSGKYLATGQSEGDVFLGDGLLFGSTDGRIIEMQRHEYNTLGINRTPGPVLDMLVDDELWARKAVLLVRIDVGVGVLDIYVTHLYFGTGLGLDSIPYIGPLLYAPTNTEREDVRSAQLIELGQFIENTHNTGNVAIVCGDFNIDGNGKTENYSGLNALQQFASRYNLQDMWSYVSHEEEFKGVTDGEFNKICATSQTEDKEFCLGLDIVTNNSVTGSRIDFLFVEHPHSLHSFNLDLTRVRRRTFPRPQTTEGQIYMSDHMGLDSTLLASRK